MRFPRTIGELVQCCQLVMLSLGVTVTIVVRSGKLAWLADMRILGNFGCSCKIPAMRMLVGVQVRLRLQYRTHFEATGGWAMLVANLWSLYDIIITDASGQLEDLVGAVPELGRKLHKHGLVIAVILLVWFLDPK